MRKTLLLLLPIAALGFAPAPVYRERPNDPDAILRRLQGGWRGVSYHQGKRNNMLSSPFRVHLDKDRWRFFTGTPPTQTNIYTITLDTKANPMRIDWRDKGTHLVGLFELSGDRLRYSFRSAGNGYPQSLSEPAPEDYVIEVEREKR